MLMHVHPENPQQRLIDQVVEVLEAGGLIIYPTDTVYGLGCDIRQRKAIDRIYAIKNMNKKKPISILCSDLSHLSEYADSVSTPAYRAMKRVLPGPYTFILNASRQMPRMLLTKQRTVGIRVPDNAICQAIVQRLGHAILSTSITAFDDEMVTDARDLHDVYGHQVKLVIDGGPVVTSVSSVIDMTGREPKIIREGKGDISAF